MLSNKILAALGKSYPLLYQQLPFDKLMNDILAILGDASDVDRVYVFKNHYDEQGDFCMSQKYEWVKGQISSQLDFDVLQVLPWSYFPELHEKLSNNEAINDFVRNSNNEVFYEAMSEQGIISYLFVPIFSKEKFWGYIGFDNCTTDILFTDNQVAALHAFATTLGMEIQMRRQKLINKRRRRNFFSFINSLDEILFKLSDKGEILFLNETWEKFSGFSVKYSLGKNIKDFIDLDQVADVDFVFHEIKKNPDKKLSKELKLVTKNNMPYWVRVNIQADYSRNGQQGFSGNMLDIHEAKTVSFELQETKHLAQLMVNAATDIFYSQFLDTGEIVFISPHIQNLGLDHQKFFEDSNYWKSHVHPDDIGDYLRFLKKVSKTGTDEIIYRINIPMGNQQKVYWIQEKAWLEKGEVSQDIKVHGWLKDITEIKINEIKLKESEEKFRLISESNPNPIFVYDEIGRKSVYSNDVFKSLIENNFAGLEIHELIRDVDGAGMAIVLDNIEKNKLNDLEVKVGSAKEYRWYSISAKPIFFNDHEYILVSLYDIHERKLTEEKNNKLNQLLQAINETQLTYYQYEDIYQPLDKLLDVILKITGSRFGFIGEVFFEKGQPYLKSHTLSNIAWSKESADFFRKNYRKGIEFRNLETLFGYPMKTRDVIISNDAENDPRAGKTTPKGHPPIKRFLGIPVIKNNELIGLMGFANKDSDYTWDDVHFLEPIVYGYANFIRSIRIIRERKTEEDLRKKADAMYKIISENTDDIIAVHDLDTTFKYVSPSIEKILGYTPNEVIGKKPIDIFKTFGTSNQINVNSDKLVLAHHIKNSKKIVQLEILKKTMYDDVGNPSGFIAVSRDVTEREIMLVQLKESLMKEQELSKLKSRFISMISHEFRTPLATIMSSAELLLIFSNRLENEDDKEKTKLHLNRINSQVSRLTGVISDILILEKGTQNKLFVSKEKIFLIRFIKRLVLESFSDDNGNLKINLILPKEEKAVITDPNWLTHILTNIIENAVKYSDKSSNIPELELSYLPKNFIVRVKDWGIGIPKEDQKYVFGSFFRAKNVSTIQGTGLGLNIVKEFIGKLGGKVTFKSEEGKGSEFTIKLPYEN